MDTQQIRDMYLSGSPGSEIADKLGIKLHQVYYQLDKMGVDRRSNKVNSRKYQLDEHYFDVIDTEAKAYWLGFLFADGQVGEYSGQWVLKVDLKSDDVAHLEALRSDLSSDYPVKVFDQSTAYGDVSVARLVLTSEILVGALIGHGCAPKKTWTLAPPSLPAELERHFIRGFVDGDGSIAMSPTSKSGLRLKLVGTREMLEWVKSKLPRAASVTRHRSIFSLEAHSDSVLWLYEDSSRYLDRKYARYEQIKARKPGYDVSEEAGG